MIARRYGVRAVRHRPASDEPRGLKMRWASAQAETVRSGSGVSPSRQARSSSAAPSNDRGTSGPASRSSLPASAEVRPNIGELSQMLPDMSLQDALHPVRADAKIG